MSLSDRIKKGDSRDALEVNNNFAGLESLTNDVKKEQLRRSSIDTDHIQVGQFKIVQIKSNTSTVAIHPSALSFPYKLHSISALDTELGELVIVKGWITLVGGAGGSCALAVSIQVDTGSTQCVREISLDANQEATVQIAWAFEATASSHNLNFVLEASPTPNNIDHLGSRFMAMAIHR